MFIISCPDFRHDRLSVRKKKKKKKKKKNCFKY